MNAISRSLSRFAGAALVCVALMAGAQSARAENLLVAQDYETDVGKLQSLMEPIAPFVGGDAGSTTSIIQLGASNSADSGITGNGSLAVVQQAGSGNRAVQAIDGNSSALLLVQGGTNNNVVQASRGDNNFQLVGVSGNNNDVAYIQSGDNLAGALDVTNAQNSTVLAIQTPQSGRYMMPSGLSGIQNKVVVVVPGRMYVINKR